MKKLIFIPYQDVYDYSITRIMTREYALLSILMETKLFDEVVCIGKPRTILDYNRYVEENDFPNDSIEKEIKALLDHSIKIRYETIFNLKQIMEKRIWWCDGYLKTLKLFNMEDYDNCVVYCNSPFAWKLLVKLKERGARIIFDMMDNFSIHPSLSQKERIAAYRGYRECFKSAEFVSCNSDESRRFCMKEFGIKVELIKNGVFFIPNNQYLTKQGEKVYESILDIKSKYSCVVGYIGKLGKRIDSKLLTELVKKCDDKAFVLVGPKLKDQQNKQLEELINKNNNVFHFNAIPSSDVNSLLYNFDVLMIPHSVGKNENGGDPLKLYQYLMVKKPIISTDIIGVREFENIIKISNDLKIWKDFFVYEEYKKDSMFDIPVNIFWSERCKALLEYIKVI